MAAPVTGIEPSHLVGVVSPKIIKYDCAAPTVVDAACFREEG